MLKELVDLCLLCISRNLHVITNIQSGLPTKFKEILIERLGFHDKFTPEYLPHIEQQLFCAALKKINFYECPHINDSVLVKLADCKCQLQSLSIDGCENITDYGLQFLLCYQTQLDTLELISLPEVRGSCLKNLHSPELQYFIFQEHYQTKQGIDHTTLCSFIDNNRSLVFVRIHKVSSSKKLTDKHLSEIITSLEKHLRYFYITGKVDISDENLNELSKKCPNLRTLKITTQRVELSGNISEYGLRNLFSGCEMLSDLDLSYYHEFFRTQHGSCALPVLPKSLISLTLDGNLAGIDEDILYESLTQLPELQKLDINVEDISADVIDRILAKIGYQFKDLRLICILNVCSTMQSAVVSVVTHCVNLHSLNIYTCAHLDGRVLYPLLQDEERTAKLRHLKINGNLAYDVLLDIANSCPNLETLALSNQNPNDECILALSQNCPNLNSLDLSGQCPDVSEDAICKLAMSCCLRCVMFPDIIQITDKLVKTMAYHCPWLVFVRFSDRATISPDAIEMLRDNCIKRVYILLA